MNRDVNLGNANKGSALMKERFWSKRVLIVLDDVDDIKQIWPCFYYFFKKHGCRQLPLSLRR